MKRLAQHLEDDFFAGFGHEVHFELELPEYQVGKRMVPLSAVLPLLQTWARNGGQ